MPVSSEAVPDEDVQAATGEALIEVRGLKTYYGGDGPFSGPPVKAVDGVDFEIKRGETLGLVGESGSGKTTLGRTLLQLEQATEGKVLFDGRDITEMDRSEVKEWRKNAQMVFQDPESSLNSRMTVGQIVREPLDVHDWETPRERQRRVRELLETVGLKREHYYRYPHQFSGGQRQRVGIARALALEPEFLVLDEPVSALDVSVQAQILNLLEDLQDEFGLTYLFIAHDLSVVRHVCDRVAVMYLGNVMEIGDTEELFADPANPYTHSLLSAIPEPDPTVEKDRITLRGTPPNPRDPPSGCPFSTRCPMKIRPDEHEGIGEAFLDGMSVEDLPRGHADLDDEAWTALEVFLEVLRERERADRSLTDRIRELLGRETRFSDVDEILDEEFGDVDLPPEVREHVETAADYAREDREDEAIEHLLSQIGSVCDFQHPEYYDVGGGRQSLCHRHAEPFVDPDDHPAAGDD